MKLTFGSVCSGIEAASVAWEPIGFKPEWFSEIEAFPSAVLAHHWPKVPNLGDMTKLAEQVANDNIPAPEILVGGTPCQAFSVAGARKGLSDERGQLTISYGELADAIDQKRTERGEQPSIIVWENVPGVLSSKDNAFGAFLGLLSGEECELVPPGKKWANAGYVYGPKRAIAWRILDAQYFGVAQRRKRVFVVASARTDFNPARVLFESEGVRRDFAPCREPGKDTTGSTGNGIARCITAGEMKRQDWETCNFVVEPVKSYCLQHAQIGRKDSAGPQGKGWQEEVGFTLDSRSCADAVAIVKNGSHWDDPINAHPTLNQSNNIGGIGQSNQELFSQSGSGIVQSNNLAVRRLTPIECERLQGFPDGHTLVEYRGKPVANGHRYKALGNSMAVPCMAWIGQRIATQLMQHANDNQPASGEATA